MAHTGAADSPAGGGVRLTVWAAPVGFATLAAVLGRVGALSWLEVAWWTGAVALALVPSGLWGGTGLRRRAAELLVVPAAFAMTMVAGTAVRWTIVPPLLLLVAWTAAAAAWRRAGPARQPLLAACLGLSLRCAAGLGLVGFPGSAVVPALALAAVAPWAAARRRGPRAAELTALAAALLPWQRWPLAAAIAVPLCIIWVISGSRQWRRASGLGWVPGVGGAAVVAAAVSSWPAPGVTAVFPSLAWPVALAAVLVAVVSLRLPPGAAGLVWWVVAITVGSVLPPTPEHRAFDLTPELSPLELRQGNGGPWTIDVDVRGGEQLDPQTPAAVLQVADQDHILDCGGTGALVVQRPLGLGARSGWRSLYRWTFQVGAGVQPVLSRHPGLPEDVTVRVETVGPAVPTPPRRMALPSWMVAAAAAVVVLQLLTGGWRQPWAVVPWLPLVAGTLVARAAAEPLHLAGERLAPDLALAALVAAWLPALKGWLASRREWLAVTALLLPLALATPQLTPPMYGDEPFHLLVMESLTEDHDLMIADDLDLEHSPQNALYEPGWPLFHSPVLGLLLVPGYVIGGRAGALALLALAGGLTVALIARRARGLGVGATRAGVLVSVLALTYPLATFATQIWPELPGALAVAGLLLLATTPRGGRVIAAVLAAVAAAVKTRLALLTFPVAGVSLLKRRSLVGIVVLTVACIAALVVGWATMGHPFGPYRRLHHLLPRDPVLALKVMGGLLFDAAGGLAFTAPLLLMAVLLLPALWRHGGAGERALLAGCGLTVGALLSSSEWYGGGAPPARYLVPMLPAFALAGGLLLHRPWRWRRHALLLVPPSLVAWWVLVTRPHRSINPGDGGYWLADDLARRFAADARSLFPSFLVPSTATWLVPAALCVAVAAVIMVSGLGPKSSLVVRRSWIALWLVAAATLVLTLEIRHDTVVEVEAPQVRRHGGSPIPAPGAVARYSHRRGWRLNDGNSVEVPLHVGHGSEVVLEGWLLGGARRRGELAVSWNQEQVKVLRWRGREPSGRVRLPPPPGPGHQILGLAFSGPDEGAVVLDRVILSDDSDTDVGEGGAS